MSSKAIILVPVDFSSHSRAATERALVFASACGAKVKLLHALHLPPIATEFGFFGSGWEDLRASEASKLDAFRSDFEGRGVNVSSVLEEREPTRAMNAAARAPGVELIVMGSHGLRGLDRFLLGSVAERTLDGAPAPVLIVREAAVEAKKPVESILFATDFSESAQKAEATVVAWAQRLGAEVELFHVAFETIALFAPYAVPSSSDFDSDVREAAMRRMDAVSRRFKDAGIAAKSTIVSGFAAEEILKYAESTGARCIAMGATGHSGMRKIRIGSVVHRVLRHAPCSVLVAGSEESTKG